MDLFAGNLDLSFISLENYREEQNSKKVASPFSSLGRSDWKFVRVASVAAASGLLNIEIGSFSEETLN